MNEIEVRRDNLPATSPFPEAAQSLVAWAESASAAYELARRIVTTSFCPAQYKGKPDEAAAAMLAGAEVGLSPMASLRAFDNIQGVTAPRALTLRAIVLGQGHEIVVEESTAQRCAGRGRRKGAREWQSYEFTIAMARDLGLLGKDQWKKQPGTMLIARFTSGICRMIAADAILGIPYSAEEVSDQSTTVEAAPPTTTRVARKKPEPAPIPEPDLTPEDALVEPEPVEAEVIEPSEPDITPSQLKNVHRLLGKLGVGTDREAGLAYIREALGGTDIQSSKELTLAQARTVIDFLMDLAGEKDA